MLLLPQLLANTHSNQVMLTHVWCTVSVQCVHVNMRVIKLPLSLTQDYNTQLFLIIIDSLLGNQWKHPLKCADLTHLRSFNSIIIAQECLVLHTEVGRGRAPEITCFITSPSLMIRCKAVVTPTLWISLYTHVTQCPPLLLVPLVNISQQRML